MDLNQRLSEALETPLDDKDVFASGPSWPEGLEWSLGGGINWCWYLGYKLHDGGIEIVVHDRLHRFSGERHPAPTSPERESFEIIEGPRRVAQEVILTGYNKQQKFKVLNPKGVFEYGHFNE